MRNTFLKSLVAGLIVIATPVLHAQIDSRHRNLLQLGYDQPLAEHGPRAAYLYYYYSNPEIIGTNVALRMAIAPVYFDGELGFKGLLSPNTDLGIGLYGGAYGDNYYEVRRGHHFSNESFDGHGGGASVSIYQLLNPGYMIPLNAVLRGGARYATYSEGDATQFNFELPDDRITAYVRAGLRLAGKEPVLDPALGLELSIWFERQWRSEDDAYGFADDRRTQDQTDLYWLYAGINYSWTNIGHQVAFATTLGGSSSADRFSAWRLGGVLPLVSEFPLILPGYYYQELTAERFVHFYASYMIPLDRDHRFQFRAEAASARLDYLPGFEQDEHWQTGVGGGITFSPRDKAYRIVARYGYGLNALRKDDEGAHSVGILFQYDFESYFKKRREARKQ
jgi:hypothetical protein